MKHLTTTILILLTIQACLGQSEPKQDYTLLFKIADSINNLHKPFTLDYTLPVKLKKLDGLLPSDYFAESIRLYEKNKFEDAAVVYYIGVLRHKYYCIAAPDYAPNFEWQVTESMQATYGKNIILFLKTNIDRYISVINYATDYCKNNDYLLSPKQKNIDKYNSSIDALDKVKKEYEKSKELYTKQWNEERRTLLVATN